MDKLWKYSIFFTLQFSLSPSRTWTNFLWAVSILAFFPVHCCLYLRFRIFSFYSFICHFSFFLFVYQTCKFIIVQFSVTIQIHSLNGEEITDTLQWILESMVTSNKRSTLLWSILLFVVIHLNSFLLTYPLLFKSNIL